MAFKVVVSANGLSDLNQLPETSKYFILSWLNKNVEGCYNPRAIGYQLEKYNYNYWKYRLGNYRILSIIEKDSVVVLSVRNDNS